MICPECRHDNIEGVDFCANCGHDLYGLDQSDAPGADRGVEFIHEPLSEVPARGPVKVNSSDPVGLAVRMMQHTDTSCVLVMDGSRLAGIITPWDILHKVAGPSEDLNAVTCGQIMTADPVFLRDSDDIAVAVNKMSIGGFRHIPLLQGEQPVAVVSIGDVFRHIASHLA
jgi:CBS domain-containing protein